MTRLVCALVALGAMGAVATWANGASQSITVSMSIPSISSVSTAGCSSGSAATSFGSVLPLASATTGADCTISFGSSNDTSTLRAYQADGLGAAMFRPANGTVDSAWGGGVVTTGNAGYDAKERGAALQPDGKLIEAGFTSTSPEQLMVARFTTAGALDSSFGSGGVLKTSIGGVNTEVQDVAVDPSGLIYLATEVFNGGTYNAALVRLKAAGSLDTTFNGTGYRIYTANLNADSVFTSPSSPMARS